MIYVKCNLKMKNFSLVSCHLKFLFYCDFLIPTSIKCWLLEVFHNLEIASIL